MKALLLFIVINIPCLLNLCNAQEYRYIYYLDDHLAATNESKAAVIGKGFKEDDGLFRLDYFAKKEKKLLITAHFIDSSIAVLQGQFTFFYDNGTVQTEGNYLNDQKDALWQQWNNKGLKTDSVFYKNGKAILTATFNYHANKELSFYSLTDSLTDTYRTSSYNDKGVMVGESFFKGKLGILKTYDSGMIKVDSVFTREEHEATFPGGEAGWRSYLEKNLNPSTPIEHGAPIGTYEVIVKFIVDKDGSISDVVAETRHGYGMENEVVRIIQKGPSWVPATQYGRKFKAYRRQPITFYVKGN